MLYKLFLGQTVEYEVVEKADCFECFLSREGVIIECPLNDLFHDAHDMILTSEKSWLLTSVVIQVTMSITFKRHQIFITVTMMSIRGW